jgi:hypothetical protein
MGLRHNFFIVAYCISLLFVSACQKNPELNNPSTVSQESSTDIFSRAAKKVSNKPTVESLTGLACNVDVNFSCKPKTGAKLPNGLTGTVWQAHTLAQRTALYLSSAVQGSAEYCQKFALMMKTECMIETPVISMFYDQYHNLKETNIVVGFDTQLFNNTQNQSFESYQANRDMFSCPGTFKSENITVGENLVCASSAEGVKWRVSGSTNTHESFDNVPLPQFDNQSLIVIPTESGLAGGYTLEAAVGGNWPNSGSWVRISALPSLTLECHLINNNLGVSCSFGITGGEYFLISGVEWFLNGVSVKKVCRNAKVCSAKIVPADTYFVQAIARNPNNLLARSNVAMITVPNTDSSGRQVIKSNLNFAAATPSGGNSIVAPIAKAADKVGTDSFTASWNAVAGVLGYKLSISTSNSFSTFVSGYNNKNVANILTQPVTGLKPNTTYYYRVTAFNNSGSVSTYSNTVTLTTKLIAPTPLPVTNYVADGFTTNWKPVKDAAGYTMQGGADTSFLNSVESLDVGRVTAKSFSGLNHNTTYFVRVAAYNAAKVIGEYSWIKTILGAPVANAALGVTTDCFTASWNPVTGAGGYNPSGYKLTVATNNDFTAPLATWNNVTVKDTETSKQVCGLNLNTTYYYRVAAYRQEMNSIENIGRNSNTVTVKTAATKITSLIAPVALAATNLDSSLFGIGMTLSWNAVAGAAGYQVFISTAADFSTLLPGTLNLNVGGVTSLKLGYYYFKENTTYYFRVVAKNGVITSTPSNTIVVPYIFPVSPSPVYKGTQTETSLILYWPKISDAVAYQVTLTDQSRFELSTKTYFDQEVGIDSIYLNNSVLACANACVQHKITGLTKGVTYWAYVRAKNKYGNLSNNQVSYMWIQ